MKEMLRLGGRLGMGPWLGVSVDAPMLRKG